MNDSPDTPAAADPPAAENPDATVRDLEDDLSATRERLAASVEALAAKADVKAQAKAAVSGTAQQARAKADEGVRRVRELTPVQLAAGVAALVGAVVLTVLIVRTLRR